MFNTASGNARTAPAPQQGSADRAPAFDSRIISYACVVLLAGYGSLLVNLFAHGYTLFGYKDARWHDFSMFWAAGRLAWTGKAAAAYDWTAINDVLKSSLPGGSSLDFVALFLYPPWFLILLAPLGALPFAVAAAIWLTATLVAYLAAMHAALPSGTVVVAALAAPPVLFNLLSGQNGLLTAALIGGALVMLDASPIAAGMLVGLLGYKPHLGVLFPLFLIVTGRWRVFTAAAGTFAALVGTSAALFGAHALDAFARESVAAGGAFQHERFLDGNLASTYALIRGLGWGSPAALCVHAVAAVSAAVGSLWVASGRARADLTAASIATAVVIVTPYIELDDLAILSIPMVFLVRDALSAGFSKSEWAALAAAFLMPLLYLLSILTGWSKGGHIVWAIGPLMCAILTTLIGRRVVTDRRAGA